MELEKLISAGNFRRFLVNLGVAKALILTNRPDLPGGKCFTDAAEIEMRQPAIPRF